WNRTTGNVWKRNRLIAVRPICYDVATKPTPEGGRHEQAPSSHCGGTRAYAYGRVAYRLLPAIRLHDAANRHLYPGRDDVRAEQPVHGLRRGCPKRRSRAAVPSGPRESELARARTGRRALRLG